MTSPSIPNVIANKTTDPLLQDDNRYVMFPILNQGIWEMYKKALESFWRCEEVDLSKDLKDWEGLSSDERHFISMILAFFCSIGWYRIREFGYAFHE